MGHLFDRFTEDNTYFTWATMDMRSKISYLKYFVKKHIRSFSVEKNKNLVKSVDKSFDMPDSSTFLIFCN